MKSISEAHGDTVYGWQLIHRPSTTCKALPRIVFILCIVSFCFRPYFISISYVRRKTPNRPFGQEGNRVADWFRYETELCGPLAVLDQETKGCSQRLQRLQSFLNSQYYISPCTLDSREFPAVLFGETQVISPVESPPPPPPAEAAIASLSQSTATSIPSHRLRVL